MRRIERVPIVVLAVALMSFGAQPGFSAEQKGTTMKASGPFDVKVAPAAQETFPEGSSTGRFSLDKQYHGDLEAVAKGEMLTAGKAVCIVRVVSRCFIGELEPTLCSRALRRSRLRDAVYRPKPRT